MSPWTIIDQHCHRFIKKNESPIFPIFFWPISRDNSCRSIDQHTKWFLSICDCPRSHMYVGTITLREIGLLHASRMQMGENPNETRTLYTDTRLASPFSSRATSINFTRMRLKHATRGQNESFQTNTRSSLSRVV